MKKKINPLPALAIFAVACLFSYFDREIDLWFMPLICWLIGTFLILRSLRRALTVKISSLKASGSTNEYIATFLTVGLEIAAIVLTYTLGFCGEFRFDPHVFGEISEDTELIAYLLDCATLSGAMMLALAFVTIAAAAVPPVFIKEEDTTDFSSTVGWMTASFIMLSHLCGVVDFEKIVLAFKAIIN